MKKYDVILIGTGAANIIADAAQLAGKKVALIERGAYGGTCLNRGCIPTKILVSAANAVLSIKEAARIGVKAEQVTLDWKTVSRRLQAKLSESPEIKTYYEAFPNVDTFDGTASFTGKKTLSIAMNDGTTEELEGKMIVIGTGGRTNIPKFPGFEDVGYITSESFFTDAFPQRPYKSLIILGGGPIGCEFAHIFDAAGTDVTIVQHNVRLLPKEDADVSTFLLKQFQNRGLHVALNKETLSARIENGEKVVVLEDRGTGEKTEVRGEEILVAPGIRPMTDLLHLENTDVTVDKRGYIETNEFLETAAEGIWAIGDVNGRAPFRHKANYEAEILADNLFGTAAPAHWRWAEYGVVPAVTYTYPEAAHVGLTADAAQKLGYRTKVAANHFSHSAKGYALGYEEGADDDGFIKLVLDADTGKILGAHIIGPEASILIQPFIDLMNSGTHVIAPLHPEIASETVKHLRAMPLTRILDPHNVRTLNETMTPHPSLSEVTMWTRYYVMP